MFSALEYNNNKRSLCPSSNAATHAWNLDTDQPELFVNRFFVFFLRPFDFGPQPHLCIIRSTSVYIHPNERNSVLYLIQSMHATGTQRIIWEEKKKEREKKDLAKLLFLHERLTYTDELLAHLPAHPYFNLMTSCLFILYMYKGLTWTRLFVLAYVFFLLPISMYKILSFFFPPFHVMFHFHYLFLGIELRLCIYSTCRVEG